VTTLFGTTLVWNTLNDVSLNAGPKKVRPPIVHMSESRTEEGFSISASVFRLRGVLMIKGNLPRDVPICDVLAKVNWC
jgi:hypothetical protein